VRLLGGWWLEPVSARTQVGPAAQRLIALLGLRGAQSRRQAARTLFPEHRDGAAAGRLRDLLSRALRGDRVLAEVLAPGPDLALDHRVSVDVRGLEGAIEALRSGRVDAVPALPREVDLLPGWSEAWVIEDRERLRHNLSRALKHCSTHCLRDGDLTGALVAAEHAVRLDPLDEQAAQGLIRAHLAAGDPGPALRRFGTLRSALRDELGVEPEPATVELVHGLGLDAALLSRAP
jgi:DNA-binding SARP family transcriptional activator